MSIEGLYTVLVTGFGPFQGFPVNPSWEVVKYLQNSIKWPASIKLITKEFPVIYETVSEQVPNLWKNLQPHLVVHCEVAEGAKNIFIEKQAFNKAYTSPDIENKCPKNNCCKIDGKDKLVTEINVNDLCLYANDFCKKRKLPLFCEESYDPGRYLCGFTYYLSLSEDESKSLFVHVPSDGSKIEDLGKAVQYIILRALKNLYDT